MPVTVSTMYPNVGALAIVELLRTELVNCEVKLAKADFVLSPSLVLTDFTEADFSGYAAEVVAALLPAYINPDGGAAAQIATIQFDHTGGATANSIYGFWVETTGGDLISVGKFDAPVAMAALGDAIPLNIQFVIAN